MLALRAHAKINLHLHVGERRNDGYHGVETLFQEISLHDTLRFSAASRGIHLKADFPRLPTDKNNLIVCALHLLKRKMRAKSGIHVGLEKRIPMGAGLGGGSSDAAAALWGGWILWKGGNTKGAYRQSIPPLLFQCASQIGSRTYPGIRSSERWKSGAPGVSDPDAPTSSEWVSPRVGACSKIGADLS